MTTEFKSFYKTVGGNEGSKCKYPTRLDTYGKGCFHDCKYCVDGDTDILMYDGSTKKMRDVEVGDEIYGVAKNGTYHRLTKAIVLNKWSVSKPSYKITIANGRELICSDNHRWLSTRGWKYTTGAMTGKERRPYLTVNNQIMGLNLSDNPGFAVSDDFKKGYLSGVIRGDGNLMEYHYDKRDRLDNQYHFRLAMKSIQAVERTHDYLEYFDVHTDWFDFPMTDRKTKKVLNFKAIRTHKKENFDTIKSLIEYKETNDFLRGFVAGIYDSEGTTDKYVKRFCNTDEEIVNLLMKGLSKFNFSYKYDKDKMTSNQKILKTVRLMGGVAEFVRFYQIFNPAIKRYGCLENVALKSQPKNWNRIVSIEPYKDEQELFDITTSTENFIANGFVSHNCYAKSLLNFRGLWNPADPAVADIEKIKKTLDKIPAGTVLRLGGMTDCFQPCELQHRVTLHTIEEMNKRNIGYLIITKSHIIANDEYLDVMNKDLAHIQVTVTTTSDDLSLQYEKASVPSLRIKAIEKLQENGFDVQLRLSPFIEEYIDFDILNNVKCDKILVEFLRVNTWIKKWFDIDYSKHTVKGSGYLHLPLAEKARMLNRITGFKQISVCEDVSEHYEFFKNNFNHNPNDCCNLGNVAGKTRRQCDVDACALIDKIVIQSEEKQSTQGDSQETLF